MSLTEKNIILIRKVFVYNSTVPLLCCRYGKPMVLDMMDVDMFETATMRFDEVQKGLMASLMSKELLKDNKLVQRS